MNYREARYKIQAPSLCYCTSSIIQKFVIRRIQDTGYKMKKILIIEDNRSIRENLIDVLETNNFQVFAASNGKEGIKLVSTINNPDLILCDIMMPEFDGYDVKAKLLENEHDALIPFIYLTAKSEVSDVRKGMILGADDYIVKPFDNRELVDSINTRLSKNEKIAKMFNSLPIKKEKKIVTEKERILLTVNNQPKFIVLSEIVSIKADANYSWIHTICGEKFIVRKLLKDWEKFLPEKYFIRIHQSYIINLTHIENVEKLSNRSFIIRMKNIKNPLPVSQRCTSKIKSRFSI